MRPYNIFFLTAIIILLGSCKKDRPFAFFEVKGNYGVLDTMQFIGHTLNADSFYWSFGDGKGSSKQSATHVFQSPGSYFVTFGALDAKDDCFSTQIIKIGTGLHPDITKNYTWRRCFFDAQPFTQVFDTVSFPLTYVNEETIRWYNTLLPYYGVLPPDRVKFQSGDIYLVYNKSTKHISIANANGGGGLYYESIP